MELVEKWLEGCAKSVSKLSHELSTLDSVVNGFLTATTPPQLLSEALVDHDYSLRAAKGFGEGTKDYWSSTVSSLKKMEGIIADPLRSFLTTDVKSFKEIRRRLDYTQRQFDSLQSRYSAQAKTKEASSLREDAFQLHEARKAYIATSMDFVTGAAQLRISLDKVLVRVFYDGLHTVRSSREGNQILAKWTTDLERVRGWSREMEGSEKAFRRELNAARKKIEENAELAARPSRELEDYSNTAGPILVKAPATKPAAPESERQGWLNLRTISAKPVRAVWVRRWFFVKNGIFGWLVQGSRSGGVEESEKIGVLLCGVRPANSEERRFCFEVKTKDTSIVLQADSHPELVEWMIIFDIAKQKALENPTSTDAVCTSTPATPQILDPAFAISPPCAPEFAATAADVGLYSEDSHDRSVSLSVPGDTNIAHRGSFDVSSGRRSTGLESDGGREQSRIIQKLDLHRKAGSGTAGLLHTPTIGSSITGANGIAGLMASGHMTLPGVMGPPPALDANTNRASTRSGISTIMRAFPPSTLAPSTFANPPNPTNLSATAVMVSTDRGIGIGKVDSTGGMPSGIMANLWGSSNWGYLNRLERGEVKIVPPVVSNSSAAPKVQEEQRATSGSATVSTSPDSTGPLLNVNTQAEKGTPAHRKTISLDGDTADLQRAVIAPQEFPNYYPTLLKHQDAQFRLLFPNIKREDKLVLVFRASWNPNDEQEFPGRVYVTAKEVYFYSHHLGLVLTTGLGLKDIVEITAAPGRDCDFLFIHLKETEDHTIDYTRITVKVFLEPLKLLQRRLNFLVRNANSADPLSIENVVKTLIKLEHRDDNQRSPSLESWEDTAGTPIDSPNRSSAPRSGRDLRARILVDQGLSGYSGKIEKESVRFKLPNKPVEYIPRGMNRAIVEKEYNISPKALFHVMFGDKSAVWQLLYHERSAKSIKQWPWARQGKAHMRRTFEYNIQYSGLLGQIREAQVIDTQLIDVQNEHLCYVVTDRKTPWHLPFHQQYNLVSKIVITHLAKSRCKLAVYTQVDWSKQPFLSGAIIESRALADLNLDALDLADVITDQVRKLGAQSRTKKAITIFGPIGHQTKVSEFGGSDNTGLPQIRRTMKQRTLTRLVLESTISLLEDIVASIIMWSFGLLKWSWKTASAHRLILLVLGVSVLANAFFSSRDASQYWKERSASRYMKRLGISSDMTMSKSIYVHDLKSATLGHGESFGDSASVW